MSMRAATALFALLAWAPLGGVRADVPRPEYESAEYTFLVPADSPSAEAVLRLLPAGPPRRDPQVLMEAAARREGPARFFPGVGKMRLVETHFRCTVFSDRGCEVVYIDVSKLKPAE
jgi:hypothetical protein